VIGIVVDAEGKLIAEHSEMDEHEEHEHHQKGILRCGGAG
jgi:hypothetical protein